VGFLLFAILKILNQPVRHKKKFKMFMDNGIYYVTLTINSDKTISGKVDGVRDSFAFMGRIVTP
jgi:hypothetical protein